MQSSCQISLPKKEDLSSSKLVTFQCLLAEDNSYPKTSSVADSACQAGMQVKEHIVLSSTSPVITKFPSLCNTAGKDHTVPFVNVTKYFYKFRV